MRNIILFATFFCLTFNCKAQTVTDIDNNTYNIISIGSQVWFKENLKTTKFNEGTAIPIVPDNSTWAALTTPGSCTYNNTTNIDSINTFGRLYNWFTISTDKLCPTGWHVSSDSEWTILSNYLGGGLDVANKLKESGTSHWNSPNTGATNESGFTALPGGARNEKGVFGQIGYKGSWWTSTQNSEYSENAWYRFIISDNGMLSSASFVNQRGYSVRCVKDNNTSKIISINPVEMILYPNPANDRLYIRNVKSSAAFVMIYDLQGKTFINRQISADYIDISNLFRGIYLIKIIDSGNIIVDKLIKE